MPSRPASRRGLALVCLIAGVLLAGWAWHSQHRPVPRPQTATLPVPARTLVDAPHVAGTELADPPTDPVFGQQARTPLLRRRVEMYQRDPASPGGTALRWADHPLTRDAADRRDFPLASADFFAGVAQLDGRWLSHQAIRALGDGRPLSPQADDIPQNMLASFSVSGNYLMSSADPAHPQPGDLRVSWTAVAWPPPAAKDASPAASAAGTAASPGLGRWRPVAMYLLAVVLLLIAAGLAWGGRRPR